MRMFDERNDEDGLSHFWNALVRGELPAREADLPPEEMAVLRRLQRAGSAPLSGLTAAEAWPRVLAHMTASPRAKEHPMALTRTVDLFTPGLSVNGREPGNVVPLHRSVHWARAQLATAALLLLTLIVSIGTIGWLRAQRTERPASLPVMMATPAAETTAETLFSATLPADRIPTGSEKDLVLWNFALEPGIRAPIAPAMQSCCRGPQITHVVDGNLTLTVDGPMWLYSGAATEGEEISPGTETVLRAGDTAVYDFSLPTEFANRGVGIARVVSGGYWEGRIGRPPFDDARITYVDVYDVYPDAPLPSGPIQVTLTQTTIPPGEATLAPPAGSLIVHVGVESDVSVGENSDGSLRNVSPREATLYILTFTPMDVASETTTP